MGLGYLDDNIDYTYEPADYGESTQKLRLESQKAAVEGSKAFFSRSKDLFLASSPSPSLKPVTHTQAHQPIVVINIHAESLKDLVENKRRKHLNQPIEEGANIEDDLRSVKLIDSSIELY